MTLRFELRYSPPLDWARLAAFLARRSIEGVESVDPQPGRAPQYRRTIRVVEAGTVHAGWLAVEALPARRRALSLEISPSLAAASAQVIARVRRLLDLDASPREVARVLGDLARGREGLRLPGAVDGFEIVVRAVLGQQITVQAARTIAGRFARAFGVAQATPFADLNTCFPDAREVAGRSVSEIASLGVPGVRAQTILSVAQALAEGQLSLAPGTPVIDAVAALEAIRGIGPWTAQYIAMRALGCADAFPASDYGVLKALGVRSPREASALAEGWRPWRSYAVIHLWSSLEKPT